jgi:two-component system, NarL family, sensor histidine kinase DesK
MSNARDPRRFRLLPPERTLGWVPYAWLIYLGTLVIDPLRRDSGAMVWTLTVLSVMIFIVSYFRAHWLSGAALWRVVALQVALGIAVAPLNMGASVYFIYASSFIGSGVEREREAFRGIIVVTIIAAVTMWAIGATLPFWISTLLFTPLIGAVNVHFTAVGRANKRLLKAQAEIHHLAAVAERERIARDLHDVLGHTLSLITLKSELASKIAERDPARAAREMRDVEQVSRTALAEVREAIRGYRASLESEIDRARTLLDTVGVRLEVERQAGAMDRAREEVLALALRELVTNVVRHAGARTCRISIGETPTGYGISVEDDGRGGVPDEGSGIRGMRERLETLGGSLVYEGARGMRATATIPFASLAKPNEETARAAGERSA